MLENKQIIIDGVDVSKCFYLGYKKECGLKIYLGPRDSFDSYEEYEAYCSKKMFKCNVKCPYAAFQLVKNKEKKIDEYVKKTEQQLKAKEQECERLKEEINSLVCSENCYKYEQTLAEIKNICNNNDVLKGNFNLVDCDKYKLGKYNLAQKIIAKINEVENEKNM